MRSLLRFSVLATALMVVGAHVNAARQTGFQAEQVAKAAHEASVQARVGDKRAKCMSAVGHAPFCDCLSGALPLNVDFQGYVAVAIEREQSREDRQIVNAVIATRNSCVASAFRLPAR